MIAVLYRSGLLTKYNKYELIGYYPYSNGLSFKGKNIKYEGSKIGFVNREVPTSEGFIFHFYIDRKMLIPKGSCFHEASGYKEGYYINIRKEKSKENYQPGDTIEYVDIMKKKREKWRKDEEARKKQISKRWQWLRDFSKQLQKWQKESQ